MAIYRFESRILGRNQGHTAVGYAAYLAAEKLHDERYEEERDFTKKRQVDRIYHSQILAPEAAPDWVHDREKLWNKTEHAEKRKDAQIAREIHVALPAELTHAEKVALGLKFVRQEYVDKGMVADVSFHNFDGVGSHNPHVHVLLTTRRLEGDGFASKKEDAWRPKIARDPKTKRSIVDPDFLKEERGTWERYCNDALRQAGQDQRVDCRSLKDRGIDRTPQPKLGKAHYMEQREEWEGQTLAGEAWREAKHLNTLKDEQKALARQQAALLQEIRAESVKQAFEIGQGLAREEQTARYQQPTAPPPPTEQQPPPKPFREPWKRDWEHEHQASQERRKRRQQRRDRQERVQRKEQERHALKQQHSDGEAPPPTQDERELLRQWLEYKDRERDKPCSGGDPHHGAKPEQGNSQEQQLAKLKEEMAAFDADDPPQPPPQHKPERKHRR